MGNGPDMTATFRRLSIAALVVTIAVLAFAPGAFAQNSSVDTYGGSGGNIQSGISDPGDPGDPGDPSATDAGSLPFTGLDLGLAAGGGLLLLGLGAGMAMLSSPRRVDER
jgi:hypothetical protein